MFQIKNNKSQGDKKVPKDLGIYLHIPFCIKKCDYCDFLSGPADDKTKHSYFDALLTEIRSYAGKVQDYLVQTVFIGGGTPSAVDAAYITEVIRALRETFSINEAAEISIEVNPGTISKDKLSAYKEAGINRISFGLQSTDARELKLLGRIHSYMQFEENYYLARELGFTNLNVDLMSALPGQTLETWVETLHKVAQLRPEHISAYSLIIEEGTPFYKLYGEKSNPLYAPLPDEDTDRLIYQKTKEILKEYGYPRYEISNYAKPGMECRHNTSYWIGTQYLGLGLGSASLINHTRFHNLTKIGEYIKLCQQYADNVENAKLKPKCEMQLADLSDQIGLRQDLEQLTKEQQMEEFMFLGLRLCKGISRLDFNQRFQVSIDEIYGEVLCKLIKKGLLLEEGDRLYLSDYGIDISNQILSEFLF